MIMRWILAIFFFFCLANGHSQDLTGIWRGHFRSNESYQRLAMDDDRYRFEVQIAQKNKRFQAVTYSYKSTVFYGKADAEGTVNDKTRKVLLRELRITDVRMSGGFTCKMTCLLQYSKLGDDEFLEGTYTSFNTMDSSDCGKGTVFLHRVASSDFFNEPFVEKRQREIEIEKKKEAEEGSAKKNPAPPPAGAAKTPAATKGSSSPSVAVASSAGKKTTPKPPAASTHTDPIKTNPGQHAIELAPADSAGKIDKNIAVVAVPSVLTTRSTELVRTITVNTPEVELNIYDDGTIDNDSVTVYFDNKMVVSHARLTTQAIVVKLRLDNGNNTHELVLVADNEGDIPPNTSLMVVKAGSKQYDVRIVSTEQRNAKIIFKYEKPAY